MLLLLVYVDDLMLTGNHSHKIAEVQQALCAKYEMSLLGTLSLYLGVEFYSQPWGTLMNHKRYILQCLHDLGLTNCKVAYTPLDPGLILLFDMKAPLVEPTYLPCCCGKTTPLYQLSF
jgi:hypothetical protein